MNYQTPEQIISALSYYELPYWRVFHIQRPTSKSAPVTSERPAGKVKTDDADIDLALEQFEQWLLTAAPGRYVVVAQPSQSNSANAMEFYMQIGTGNAFVRTQPNQTQAAINGLYEQQSIYAQHILNENESLKQENTALKSELQDLKNKIIQDAWERRLTDLESKLKDNQRLEAKIGNIFDKAAPYILNYLDKNSTPTSKVGIAGTNEQKKTTTMENVKTDDLQQQLELFVSKVTELQLYAALTNMNQLDQQSLIDLMYLIANITPKQIRQAKNFI